MHNLLSWPPTPGNALVALTYVRLAYNGIYKYAFGNLERQWDLAVQWHPREGETDADAAARNRGRNATRFNGFEIEVEVGIAEDIEGGDSSDEEALEERRAGEPMVEVIAPPFDENPPRLGRRQNHGRENWVQRQDFQTESASRAIIGAIFFPRISSLMGQLLKRALPKQWTGAGKQGFLNEQWSRTLVGGCAFVVLKDALLLYCKWKKARDFGKKRVLDYVRP